jgi:hemerythrin-like domain-containing protein
MHGPLQILQSDHTRFARLLNFLEVEIRRLANGEQTDLARTHDALLYFEDFPSQVHHPREDLLLERLAERALENQAVHGTLQREHGLLERETRELREALADALNDSAVPRAELVRRLGAFVEKQRAHLETEERLIFPLIEKVLTEDDWKQVTERLPDRRDPLFEATEERFRALFERIV